jgi:hypothetical protein
VTAHHSGALRVRAFDGTDARLLAPQQDTDGYPRAITVSPDGGLIAALVTKPGTFQGTCHLRRANGEPIDTLPFPAADIRFTGNGWRLASVSKGGVIRVWDPVTRSCLREFPSWEWSNRFLSSVVSGRLLVPGDHGAIELWDLDQGKCVSELHEHKNGHPSASLSPDGRLALSSGWVGDGYETRLWDTATWKFLRLFEFDPKKEAIVVRFSPDGAFAFTAYKDGKVQVWDIGSGQCLHAIAAHAGPVDDLTVAPNADFLLSLSNGEIQRWELDWELPSGA